MVETFDYILKMSVLHFHLLHELLQNFQHTSILFQFYKFSVHLHVYLLLG